MEGCTFVPYVSESSKSIAIKRNPEKNEDIHSRLNKEAQ